jgi:hypothetical protein
MRVWHAKRAGTVHVKCNLIWTRPFTPFRHTRPREHLVTCGNWIEFNSTRVLLHERSHVPTAQAYIETAAMDRTWRYSDLVDWSGTAY